MSSCLFCAVAHSDRFEAEKAVENVVLAESSDFYLKPALGSFVEGYSLIIPKDHYRTFSEIPDDILADFCYFQMRIRLILSSLYGMPTIMFEHGAACPENRAGSCIDHAHMHILPFRGALPLLFHIGDVQQLQSQLEIKIKASGRSYLYIEDGMGSRMVIPNEPVPSQFLRQLAATYLGKKEMWDWRKSPFRDAISRYIALFRDEENRMCPISQSLPNRLPLDTMSI